MKLYWFFSFYLRNCKCIYKQAIYFIKEFNSCVRGWMGKKCSLTFLQSDLIAMTYLSLSEYRAFRYNSVCWDVTTLVDFKVFQLSFPVILYWPIIPYW